MNVLGDVDTKLSLIKDPFKSDNIQAIHMHIMKKSFTEGFDISASVEFKNGNTEGKQKFNEKNFETLYIKIKAFIETL